jgi:anti-sigma factor RsiW
VNCSRTRQILYPRPDRAETTIESAAALTHLRECADCRWYFEQQAALSHALKEKLGLEVAPAVLRERVTAQIEKHRAASPPRRFYRKRLLNAAVAVLLLVAAPLVLWLHRLPSEQFFEEVCADHAKYLRAESQLRSSDPSTIESWFHDKTEFGVEAPRYENTKLLGSRLCFLKRHKAALLFYRKSGHPVSLFQMDAGGVNLSALSRSVIDGVPVWHKSLNGFSLVALKRRGVLWVLVSDLNESDLLPLALAAWHQF